MTHAVRPLVLLMSVLLLACETGGESEADAAPGTGTPVDASRVESQIEQVRDAWISAALAGDAATVASLYTEDAVFVGADGEEMSGRQAIQEGLAAGFEALSSMEVNSVGTVSGTEMASDLGTYRQVVRDADGEEQTLSGRYLVVLRSQPDGSWKIAQHLSAPDPGREGGA